MNLFHQRVPRHALLYAAAAALWMLISDWAVSALLGSNPPGLMTSAWRVLAFVAVTAGVLTWLLRRLVQHLRQLWESESGAREHAARLTGLLQALAGALPSAIFVKDADGRFLIFNPEAERITGRTADAMLAGTGLTGLPLGQLRWLMGDDKRIHALPGMEAVEQTIATAQGDAHYRITHGPLHGPDGGVAGLFWVGQDISSQREAEQRAHDSERWYRMLFEANPYPMCVYDRETLGFLAVNAAAVHQYGHSAQAFMGLTLRDIRPDSEHGPLAERLCSVNPANDGEPQATGIWLHRRRDQSCFEVDVKVSNLTFNNRPARLALARDVTQERAAQAELMNHQRELLALPQRLLNHERTEVQRVAQVVHDELGHALAVARLTIDLARADLAQGRAKDLPATLTQVGEQLDLAAGWMRRVLADLRPPLLEEAGLAAALQHAVDSHDLRAGSASIHLDIAANCVGVRWPAAVEHVAFQLAKEALINAGLHAQASHINLVLAGNAHGLELSMADDGVGIAADMVKGRVGHLGITGMHERATAVGGQVLVSALMTRGTVVSFTWGNSP